MALKKARMLEKQGSLAKAKIQWLDIIEYCRLFVQKTPNLSLKVRNMIIGKAEEFKKHVLCIQEKIDAKKVEIEFSRL